MVHDGGVNWVVPNSITGGILTTTRAILFGWASLFAASYLIARPLLHWLGPLVGANWVPTARVALECAALGAAGWTLGRLQRDHAAPAVLLFAATLAAWNFGLASDIDIPWLVRLATDAAISSRYWESFVTTLSTQALLFGSIFAGAALARSARGAPLSIATSGLRR